MTLEMVAAIFEEDDGVECKIDVVFLGQYQLWSTSLTHQTGYLFISCQNALRPPCLYNASVNVTGS